MAQASVAPPTTLTMEEFRTAWEPQGWQLLIIGPTATWRQEWGVWEAIRDVVQNSLDETEAYSWGYDQDGLYIRDAGRGVAVADFLLGPPRPKPDYARGKFGEGMKIAALTLLREGYSVWIETVGRDIWVVFLRVKVDGTADQLAALWRSDGMALGTIFHIVGYFGPAFEDRFAVNLPRKYILHQGPSRLAEPVRRYNQLIESPPGMLYARDIYFRDIKSPYSYNLWSVEMAPDRHGPRSEWDVWTDMGRLWATVTRVDLLERLLGMVGVPPDEETEESKRLDMGKLAMSTEPVTGKWYTDFMVEQGYAWREAWRRKMGEDAVLSTDSRWDGMVRHLGYEPARVSRPVQEALAMVVRTDAELVHESQERLREVETIPDDRLSPIQRAHLRLARAIAEEFRIPPIAGVHAAIIPPASERRRTAGLYSRTMREVYISAEQLERARTTVDTVLHEIAHHTSGAEDGEEAHNAAMTAVAARVVELVGTGRFDDDLKEALW